VEEEVSERREGQEVEIGKKKKVGWEERTCVFGQLIDLRHEKLDKFVEHRK
jgi:hypothetical protein